MATFQYKAYLSYSHIDEAWAVWLHRALETYRIPKNLIGTHTQSGKVPSRIRPVFRDREDLSSAANLAESVKQSLAESENLIVICSPDASKSLWVNEEIREFARLGRSNRIFCIIVEGDPGNSGSPSSCFPAALAEVGVLEPLAADARKWADGKHVAKLKLVAGMVGLRLDELRQRDMQRQRKRQLLTGLAVVAVLALTLMTIFSRISQQHEREKAEQLATFVVDLGQRLQSDSDLETLELISTEASRNLQSLDQDKLSAETGRKVALAIRQMGQVNQYRDQPQDALQAFTKSRDMLVAQRKKYPLDAETLYELGNAEFYIGNLHYHQGGMEKAFEHMQVYFDLTQQLLATDPENPNWILEFSYAHNNLAALQIDSGKGIDEVTLNHVSEATKLMEKVVELKPNDDDALNGLATVLAWAADAQLMACDIDAALELRSRVKKLAQKSSRQSPANNNLKQNLAFAMTGMARILALTGKYDLAKENLLGSVSILQLQADADPSNVIAKQDVASRRVMLAKLLVDLRELDAAFPILEQLSTEFEPLDEIFSRDARFQRDYIDYLIVSANVDFLLQKPVEAALKLQASLQHQQDLFGELHRDISDYYRQAHARHLWWEIDGSKSSDYQSSLLDNELPNTGELQSCSDADASMRVALIEGDKIKAKREADYLLSKGYAAPDFIRICTQYELCPGS